MQPSPRQWVLFAFTVQHSLISWFLGLLSMATYFTHEPRFEGTGILSLKLREWFSKGKDGKGISPYSSVLFRTIFWHAGRATPGTVAEELDTRHEQHERVHIHQFEDKCVQGFTLGAALACLLWAFGWYAEAWQPALVWELLWLLTPVLMSTNWLTAVLRWGLARKERDFKPDRTAWERFYDVAYLDSEHERSARAQTEGFDLNGRSWTDREDAKRR